jgi:3-oxoacyl-[acyl-carrier protein] reductase
MKYQNQNVIVTGGTRGIGKAITLAFLKEGAKVIATFSNNMEAAESLKVEAGEYASNLILRKFDVSNSEDVNAFYQYVEENFEAIHVLVNNSGIRKDNMVAMMPDEDFKRVLDINLNGTFLMSKHAVLNFMKNRYGRVVNISSIGGDICFAGQSNYAASKAAQLAFSKSLAKEVAKKGVTVNCVSPGFIETDLISDLPQEQIKEYKKQVPMKRFGKTSEVASAVLYLASKEAGYITGANLEIAGGL